MPNELVFSIPETSLSSKSQSNSLTMNMTDLRTTIFVGNLSVFCTEQDLEQVFSRYGTILEIRMAKSEDRSKHLSYGFIKFASVASAQLAMIELDGRILCGRPLK
jgi:RNA recognition motif-containing protein